MARRGHRGELGVASVPILVSTSVVLLAAGGVYVFGERVEQTYRCQAQVFSGAGAGRACRAAGESLQDLNRPPRPVRAAAKGVPERRAVYPGLAVTAASGQKEMLAATMAQLEKIRATAFGEELFRGIEEASRHAGEEISIVLAPGKSSTIVTSGDPYGEPGHYAAEIATDARGKPVAVRPKQGGKSSVLWDPERPAYQAELEDVERAACPAGDVFLAHELIHGVRNLRGVSFLGKQIVGADRLGLASMDEAATIGLGPFAGDPLTENAYRRELGLPLRTTHQEMCDLTRQAGPADDTSRDLGLGDVLTTESAHASIYFPPPLQPSHVSVDGVEYAIAPYVVGVGELALPMGTLIPRREGTHEIVVRNAELGLTSEALSVTVHEPGPVVLDWDL